MAGIGVGIAGIVNEKSGGLVKSPSVPSLDGWNIARAFASFRVLAKNDNDSRCFTRAEAFWGAGRGYRNVGWDLRSVRASAEK